MPRHELSPRNREREKRRERRRETMRGEQAYARGYDSERQCFNQITPRLTLQS